jgi:ABC-type transport system involved in cytochrome bd biosynthesis fused ATPase/permease subunit
MTKKKIKQWRNNLTQQVLEQFTGLNEKKTSKLQQQIEKNIANTIKYYLQLLPKKQKNKSTALPLSSQVTAGSREQTGSPALSPSTKLT